jgi:FkbM family methyltransferase
MQSPYLVENRHIAVKRCKHGLFMYNRNDAFVGRGLDLYGEWCDFEIQLMRLFIKPGDIIIDAGANIGTHTVAFANIVGQTGVVHAFEPQRRNFQMLCGNVAINGLDNVFCHQAAVGDALGQIRLPAMPSADTHFNFSAVAIGNGADEGESVPLVTLDSLNLPSCRVIKIDTEGMEPQVLSGARGIVERYRPILYLENNEAGASQRLAPVLERYGYSAWWSIFPYFDPRNFYSNTVNVWEKVVPASNLICVPKELNLQISNHEPFLGAQDDWMKCLQRANSRGQQPQQPAANGAAHVQ